MESTTPGPGNLIGLIDFDGTIFETESYYDDCMDDLFHKRSITDRPRVDYKDAVADKYRFVTGTGWRIIIPDMVEFLTGERPTPEETESLVEEFTGLVCDAARTSHAGHAYQASLNLCRKIVEQGGRLSIHSGTEPEIVRTLLDLEGVGDLFDTVVSSHKTSDLLDGGYTRYKRNLMERLMDHYKNGGVDPKGVNGEDAVIGTATRPDTRFFVLGDSNGDGFAALELGLPFVMARRHDAPRFMTVGNEMITPVLSLEVDGDGGEIPWILDSITKQAGPAPIA